MNTRIEVGLALVLLGSVCAPAQAQTRTKQPQEIVIGQVAGYSGPVGKTAGELALGARVLIASTNAQGGVLGKKLRLVTADDAFKADETVRLVSDMDGKVAALLPVQGSANMTALIKQGVLDRVSMPLLGAIPSQESFHIEQRKNLFHFRASDRSQLDKIVEQLTTVGIQKIAVMAPNNPNGKEGTSNVTDALQKRGLKLTAAGFYEIVVNANYDPQVKAMQDAKPDAIIFLGPSTSIGEITRRLRGAGVESSLYSVSYADVKVMVKSAGLQTARGFAIAQVLPNLNNRTVPLIKAFRADFEKYAEAKDEATYFTLEGYMAVKLVVEAIRRSKDASPEGVRRGLELLREFDLGGYIVDFSPSKHSGSKWVDLSIIGAKGELLF